MLICCFLVTDFTGEGCEVAVDYCKTEGQCRHGGKCISKLDGFECECTHGKYHCHFYAKMTKSTNILYYSPLFINIV